MRSHALRMAGYNEWANARIYEAASHLTDAEYRADRGAFFKSVHGTLNHILCGDRIWMKRFTGAGDSPGRLDAILFEDFADLRTAREKEDARILGFVMDLSDADMERRLRYSMITDPREIEEPLAPALFHFFNHQTHHRGQVHCLLTGLGHAAPSLDLIRFVREQAAART